MTFNKLHPYLLFNFFCSVALLVGFAGLATGATPGEVYEKHRNEIVRGNFFIFEEYLFVVIHVETNKDSNRENLFRKMELIAFRQVLPRFAHNQYPNVDKNWFELYFLLPSFSSFNLKNSLVVDKDKTGHNAYLVLTAPVKEIKPYIPESQVIKDAVNHAFDNGVPINLEKFIRVASGDRLRLAKNKLRARTKRNPTKKKGSVEGEILNNVNRPGNNQPLKNKDILRHQGNKIDDLL